ncbi:DUF4003 family protein [Rossellomorea sp. KS-H15a]|uniref:DUF4003 family protein n=1 Tax=Rossellomorea sp. KS-H15a TaxID=2963940 RepID=UPI0020C6903B|nr:DUF4003 family protein [Rossellomorea sp. KS-H15a]UTE78772.1 DUF4003 domain-containing protein [Rossellomorea sp. KS-H15a]
MEEVMRKLEDYREIYSQLKERLRWKVSDSRSLMMVASLYVTNKRAFHIDRFMEISDYIKDEVRAFSSLKHEIRFTFAGMLDTRFDDYSSRFHEFLSLYDSLIDAGFSRGPFSYISAMTMLSDGSRRQDFAVHGMEVYKKMRDQHFFLTGQSDYPFALLLSQREGNHYALIDRIEGFYHQLNSAGFRKGNDLQSMSHILSLHSEGSQDKLVQRCIHLYDTFKQVGIKPKAMFYPQIALLSFVDEAHSMVNQVKHVWEELNSSKAFKWHKDINLMMAVNMLISDKIEHNAVLQVSLSTAIEALIQAQQATMITTVATVSVSTGSGDS